MKVDYFRGATLAYANHHHVIPIFKKKSRVIILHVWTNDSVSRTSREILGCLLQLKSVPYKHKESIFRTNASRDNGKAALTLRHLNEHFSQLNLDVVDNSNMKLKYK